METKKMAKPPTRKKGNKHRQTQKPNWGDSHARGIASELLHQLNHSYKIIGHVNLMLVCLKCLK
jgi:hypothetical protein